MENVLQDLLNNRMLISACAAWLVAQVLKTIIYCAVNKEFDFSRLTGDGGMPSGHSATVTALATRACMEYGVSSSLFAISAIFAIVVMHDAMGVRRESGKHAKAINDLMLLLMDQDMQPETRLKEFIGHTPTQVVAGALLGLIVAIISGML